MTREEALAKIRELEDYIQELDKPVGYKDDELFLLSIEEYERYKDKIPHINTWWWLRSWGYSDNSVAGVNHSGYIDMGGADTRSDIAAVRPALKLPEVGKMTEGTRMLYQKFPFICIDEEKGIFIAEVPIGFERFDSESNDYEASEIRMFLKKWAKKR